MERVLWCPFATVWAFLACTGLLHLPAQGIAWDLLLAGVEGSSAHISTVPPLSWFFSLPWPLFQDPPVPEALLRSPTLAFGAHQSTDPIFQIMPRLGPSQGSQQGPAPGMCYIFGDNRPEDKGTKM